MKNRRTSTPNTPQLLLITQQHTITQPPKSWQIWLSTYFSALHCRWQSWLTALSTSCTEPYIWQTLDQFGNTWWHAYNPATRCSATRESELEILEWLDQRRTNE